VYNTLNHESHKEMSNDKWTNNSEFYKDIKLAFYSLIDTWDSKLKLSNMPEGSSGSSITMSDTKFKRTVTCNVHVTIKLTIKRVTLKCYFVKRLIFLNVFENRIVYFCEIFKAEKQL
jgi:hypothetical protein